MITSQNYKIRCTKLRDWINVSSLLYEKTLEFFEVGRKIDKKEAEDLKKIYNH